jgi:hypothetical protein
MQKKQPCAVLGLKASRNFISCVRLWILNKKSIAFKF